MAKFIAKVEETVCQLRNADKIISEKMMVKDVNKSTRGI